MKRVRICRPAWNQPWQLVNVKIGKIVAEDFGTVLEDYDYAHGNRLEVVAVKA